MAKSKAYMAKTALYDAMLRAAISGGDTTSRAIVEAVKVDEIGAKAIKSDLDTIIDLGLMTMAGRVAARPAVDDGQADLFTLGRPKEFTELRVGSGPAASGKRVKSTAISLEQWFAQPKRRPISTVNHKTNEDVLDSYFSQMKDRGLPGETTLGQYLGIK
jgi:hypothetical protein